MTIEVQDNQAEKKQHLFLCPEGHLAAKSFLFLDKFPIDALQTVQVLVAKWVKIQFWVNMVANKDPWITLESCFTSPLFCKISWNLCRCSVDATVSADVVLCFQSCRASVYTVYTQCQRRGEVSQNLDGIMILLRRWTTVGAWGNIDHSMTINGSWHVFLDTFPGRGRSFWFSHLDVVSTFIGRWAWLKVNNRCCGKAKTF